MTSSDVDAAWANVGSGHVDRDQLDRALNTASSVMQESARAVTRACARHDELENALDILLSTRGRVVFTGLGKSGLIASKLAATFASTGTPSLFVHAADALHGDAGMVVPGDVVIALSKSGTTDEVVTFAGLVKRRGIPVLAMTGCGGSSRLCTMADAVIDACVERECDPWDLVPTASTTVSLVVGDALAIALMVARQFGPDDFRGHHPGGALGDRPGESASARR
jgi:arabinose-5-phosphate isomerase